MKSIYIMLTRSETKNDAYEAARKEVASIMANADQYHFNIFELLLCRFGIPYHRKPFNKLQTGFKHSANNPIV